MLFAPFLLIYVIICLAFPAVLLFLIQVNLVSRALLVLGLSPRIAVIALVTGSVERLIGQEATRCSQNMAALSA